MHRAWYYIPPFPLRIIHIHTVFARVVNGKVKWRSVEKWVSFTWIKRLENERAKISTVLYYCWRFYWFRFSQRDSNVFSTTPHLPIAMEILPIPLDWGHGLCTRHWEQQTESWVSNARIFKSRKRTPTHTSRTTTSKKATVNLISQIRLREVTCYVDRTQSIHLRYF